MFVGSRDHCCDDKSAMAGAYVVTGSANAGAAITFAPAFELTEGQKYTIRTQTAHAYNESTATHSEPTLTEFSIAPSAANIVPEVVAVYPSAQSIPENTLRFYIEFSTPMQPHLSTHFIHLVDETGSVDTAAFMSFKQELWSQDRKRLTLLLDPGRIKRGVAQYITLGPALRQHKRYTLVIEAGWPGANGNGYTSRFEKSFSVSDGIRTLPSPELWSVEQPKLHSLDPMVIEFDRAFDYQLVQTGIRLHNSLGQIISGTVSIENHQTRWRFMPERPWMDPQVHIMVDAHLEDVAGNNFRELLDRPVASEPLNVDQHSVTLTLLPASAR